jgi:hypothetical protein
MKKKIIIIAVISILSLYSTAFATQVRLVIESYPPSILSRVSKIIDLPDLNDQLEISRQATLLALSPQGWNLASLVGGVLDKVEPPEWSAECWLVRTMKGDFSNVLGFHLNRQSYYWDADHCLLVFHTDADAYRGAHDLCEYDWNFSVISGSIGGAYWQCAQQQFGRFWVEFPIDPTSAQLVMRRAEVRFKKAGNTDTCTVAGEFVLNEQSNGIDPINEETVISVGSSTLTIPAGSFTQLENKYKFRGQIDNAIVRMTIKPVDDATFRFMLMVKGTSLDDTKNPVDIELAIGDDTGKTTTRLWGKLLFRGRR